MITLAYVLTAIAFLVLVLGLVKKDQSREPDECLSDNHPVTSIGNRCWLSLSERIFDPSDVRWLEEELAFPRLGMCLRLGRKRLALCWLQALQTSFDEIVMTPEFAPVDASEATTPGSWRMLWLTVRFKFLVSYALLVVRLFGPYHRLVPSFSSWAPGLQGVGRSFRRPALANRVSS
jgi:hypothetical protein